MISHALVVEMYRLLTAACIAGLWQGAVLAMMAAGLMRLMPRASASLRHTVLVVTFAVAVVLPWIHFGASRSQSVGLHALRIAPWMAAVIAAAWLTVACIRAASLFLAWRRLQSVWLRAVPLLLEGTDGFEAGDRHALLCISPDVDSPTILGFRDPRLLLPDWMAPLLKADDLRQIALHECEHLRRYDDWLNLLLQVGLVLSPLNPALVWLDRRIGTQRELACDAAVVASTAQPIAYATCLTRLAEQRIQRNRLVLALAAMGHTSELGRRIQALLSQPATWTQRQSRLAASATAAVLLAGAFGLARTPLFIRIAGDSGIAAVNTSAALNVAGSGGLNVGERMPAGFRMVPASFTVKPVSFVRQAHKKHVRAARHSVRADKVPSWPEQPRVIHTSATASRQANQRTASYREDDTETAIRFVTAEFSSPYVAVPVSNGWLVFQL